MICSEEGLHSFDFECTLESGHNYLKKHFKTFDLQERRTEWSLQAEKEFEEYFQGERETFTLPLLPFGTPFQREAWQTLLTIPYGKTISYQEQATLMKNPKAMRAVGGANGKNPIAVAIPCHRVIGKGGKLTGYASGLWRKEFLLNGEKELFKLSQ